MPYGTSTYAAPEQAQGLESRSSRRHLFHRRPALRNARGHVAVSAARRRWTFVMRWSITSRSRSRKREAKTRPRLLPLQEILDKALAKQPDDRYQKIEDLGNDLQEVCVKSTSIRESPQEQTTAVAPAANAAAGFSNPANHWPHELGAQERTQSWDRAKRYHEREGGWPGPRASSANARRVAPPVRC